MIITYMFTMLDSPLLTKNYKGSLHDFRTHPIAEIVEQTEVRGEDGGAAQNQFDAQWAFRNEERVK